MITPAFKKALADLDTWKENKIAPIKRQLGDVQQRKENDQDLKQKKIEISRLEKEIKKSTTSEADVSKQKLKICNSS
ncbi:MAG: hypothetical protein ABR502_05560 [Chitinophagaceae bacterium]